MTLLATTRSAPPVGTEVVAGARAMAPVIVAFVPFALVVGAGIARSAEPWAAWSGTWAIYGGAAHVAVLDVLAAGGGWLTAAAVGLLVNVRLVAYAAAMAPAWRSVSPGRRLLAAVVLTDAPWAMARGRGDAERAFYAGAAGLLFLAWPVLVSVGVVVGDAWQSLPGAGLLVPLTLGAVVVPQLRHRQAAAAASAAAVAAVVTSGADLGLGMLVAAAAGVVAGTLSGAPTERAA